MTLSNARRIIVVTLGLATVALQGCATSSNGPAAGTLASGETCSSVKAQLNKLDAKGVPASVEAQSRGKKLAPAQKADADLYNRLLNDYLGAKCHVAG